MKTNAFRNAATLVFSVTFAGAVMAQSPSPQTPQTQPPTPQTTRPSPQTQPGQDNLKGLIGQTVTVTGCVAQASASTGQTPSTQPAGAASDFILTNVQVRSGAPTPGATTTPGTPSTPGATGTTGAAGGMKIKLKETANVQLRENLNKRVEVTGRLQAASSATPGTPETSKPGATGSSSMDAMPELQVSNVRVLEQSCTPKQ